MRRSGFLGILVLALVAIGAGLIGYQAGLTANAVAAGATVFVTGGFPGFGFLFFLFFLGFVLFSLAGRRHGWAGQGGYGPWGMGTRAGGPGSASDPSDPRRQWVAELHRSLHAEEEAARTGSEPRTS